MSDRPVEQRTTPGAVTADSPLPDLPGDAVVLVSGPPMTGKYQLLLGVLARQADRAIVISTKNQASRVIEDYRVAAGEVPEERIGVVDCARHHEPVRETDLTKYADSPENLTRIGVKFTELFERFYEDADGAHVAVGLHSLSQLVMHTDVGSVYKFLQVLTGHVRSVGWFHASVIDASVVDDEAVGMIQQHFDGLIETRENEAGRREYRVQGLGPEVPWTEF